MSEFTPEPAAAAMPKPEAIESEQIPAQENTPFADVPADDIAAPAAADAATVPMAWHRFLTRFYLWAAALYHLIQAVLMFTGWSYHAITARNAVYAGLPEMRYLDWGFAALLAVGAVLQAVSARMLAKLQKKGSGVLQAAYLLLLLAQLGYGAGRYLLTGLTPFTGSIVGMTAVHLGMLVVNGSYYRKRKSILYS